MAKNKQKEDLDTNANEENPQNSEETSDDEVQAVNDGDKITINQNSQKRSRFKKKGTWILIPVLFIIIAVGAAGVYKFKPQWFKNLNANVSRTHTIKINEDNLSEKELLPFFIPPPQDTDKNIIRIDLSVIWDGLAAVRFPNMELQIRNDIYKYIVELTAKTDDLNNEISYIEAEMSRIFMEALGVKNLVIRIKEINYF